METSRIVTGKVRLHPQPIDLAGMLRAAADTVRPTVDAKGSSLELSLDPHLDRVVVDPDRLTGRGIARSFLPHVFERFRQADGATTREHGGLGLGLAIVKHLVELHGGVITADSEGEGRGARFTVRLPVRAIVPSSAPEAPIDRAPEKPVATAPDVRLNGAKVLVVDDEPDARDLSGLGGAIVLFIGKLRAGGS